MNVATVPTSGVPSSGTAHERYGAVVVGAGALGLSVALHLQQGGTGRVRVLEPTSQAPLAAFAAASGLDIGLNETVVQISTDADGLLSITTTRDTYLGSECVVALPAQLEGFAVPPPGVGAERVYVDDAPPVTDSDDVLVVGTDDWAVELAAQIASVDANVVLAAGGLDPARLSEVASVALNELAADQRFTVLYRARPNRVIEVGGYPLASFPDVRTPDLQFDYVVYASPRGVLDTFPVDVTPAAHQSGRVRLAHALDLAGSATLPVAAASGTSTPLTQRRRRVPGVFDELRTEHYNATITSFDRQHDDLWVLRVRPDDGGLVYRAGQYASLGLGYWEERIDDAIDTDIDERWDKLIRRSYSISSRIFDQQGYLVDDTRSGELEFYIVLVAPSPDHVPGLTPRLALKSPGDRIFLGTKVAGRYNLSHVTDPDSAVLFLATGTGEAPHNAMVVELLQRGHRGPIVSAVSVRQWADLGYHDKHQLLDRFHHNYHYLPLPTREPDVPKRYLQDLIASGTFESDYGITLNPSTTHVFLCGNPLMIGLPETVDGQTTFPSPVGVVELLARRGLVLDRPGAPGTIHFEEYW